MIIISKVLATLIPLMNKPLHEPKREPNEDRLMLKVFKTLAGIQSKVTGDKNVIEIPTYYYRKRRVMGQSVISLQNISRWESLV